jgi:hypothetical protein
VEEDESDAEEPSESDSETEEDDDDDSASDPEPYQPSRSETERILHTSSRLLARTLASHPPESESGDAVWMAQELGRVLSLFTPTYHYKSTY